MDKRISNAAAGIPAVADKLDFSGVVWISAAGNVLLHRAFGYRDIANRSPNTPGTRFGMASGTKLFTALAIMRLIERGDITIETPAASLLDTGCEFIHEDATVRHLLSHTSGIYDYYDEELIEDFDTFTVDIPWSELETPSDYLPLFKGKSPKFNPGERTSYSNGGYVFLGIIIERVTGELYRDFVSREVLQHAGMLKSGFFAFNSLPPDTANGYISTDGHGHTNIYQLPLRGAGDGGMFTTTDDLRVFWEAFMDGRIISEELVQRMCRRESILGETTGYGLGIYHWDIPDGPAYFITGSDAGVGFSSRHVPETGLTITVLSNTTDGNIPVMKWLLDELAGGR